MTSHDLLPHRQESNLIQEALTQGAKSLKESQEKWEAFKVDVLQIASQLQEMLHPFRVEAHFCEFIKTAKIELVSPGGAYREEICSAIHSHQIEQILFVVRGGRIQNQMEWIQGKIKKESERLTLSRKSYQSIRSCILWALLGGVIAAPIVLLSTPIFGGFGAFLLIPALGAFLFLFSHFVFHLTEKGLNEYQGLKDKKSPALT